MGCGVAGFKNDPAGEWLEAHGEQIRRGDTLVHSDRGGKMSATELADSGQQIGKKNAARKPGGINLRKVAEVLESYGMDPTEEILKVVPELDADTKARVMLGLLEYVQPKLARTEHSGPNGGPVQSVGTFNINFSGK